MEGKKSLGASVKAIEFEFHVLALTHWVMQGGSLSVSEIWFLLNTLEKTMLEEQGVYENSMRSCL